MFHGNRCHDDNSVVQCMKYSEIKSHTPAPVISIDEHVMTSKMFIRLQKYITDSTISYEPFKDLEGVKVESIKEWNKIITEYIKLPFFNTNNKFSVLFYNEHLFEDLDKLEINPYLYWKDNKLINSYEKELTIIPFKEFYRRLREINSKTKSIKINKTTRCKFYFKLNLLFIPSESFVTFNTITEFKQD